MTYQTYLQSEHWRLLRGAKLQIAPRCEACGSKEELEVHHKVYRTSWFDAKLPDLQTFCHGCHMMHHAKDWERLPEAELPKPVPEHKPERRPVDTPKPFVPSAREQRLTTLAKERRRRMVAMRAR